MHNSKKQAGYSHLLKQFTHVRTHIRTGFIALLLLCLVLALSMRPLPVTAQEAETAQDSGWQMIVPGNLTICARGTPYAFWSRARDPENLLIYFQGGGMCWNNETCSPQAAVFDDVVEGGEVYAYQNGIFNAEVGASNPVSNYSTVFVPYCTGDLHIGATSRDYGDPAGVIQHQGYENALSAITYATQTFPDASRVLVAGCSAGAYGAIYHAPALLNRYPNARVFGDSGVGAFPPGWDGLMTWNSIAHSPFGVPINAESPQGVIANFWSTVARNFGGARFAQYNTAGDAVQQRYLSLMGGGDWVGLRAATLNAQRGLRNFRSFTDAGSEHCILETERFYTEVGGDGVPFRNAFTNWLG